MFPLYKATQAISIETIPEEAFYERGYDLNPETKFFVYDQIQTIKIKNASETEWQLSGDYRRTYQALVSQAAMNDSSINITFEFDFAFERPVSF